MPDVWLFFHAADLAATREHRDQVQRRCEEHGWTFQPRPAATMKTPEGRPLPVISRDVASGLYPRVHRARVATLVIGRDPVVALHPNTEEALRARRFVNLRRYVAYKCLWMRLPSSDAMNNSWVGSLAAWCDSVECNGEHDPRCLPFHVFNGDGRNLEVADRRQQFDEQYGSGALRRDERAADWRMQPGIFHGHDELQVAGCALRRGYHWDVMGAEYRIATPRGVWLVDGHVNVYPDAHIRGNRPAVRQVI